jgi:hypothetical protein
MVMEPEPQCALLILESELLIQNLPVELMQLQVSLQAKPQMATDMEPIALEVAVVDTVV